MSEIVEATSGILDELVPVIKEYQPLLSAIASNYKTIDCPELLPDNFQEDFKTVEKFKQLYKEGLISREELATSIIAHTISTLSSLGMSYRDYLLGLPFITYFLGNLWKETWNTIFYSDVFSERERFEAAHELFKYIRKYYDSVDIAYIYRKFAKTASFNNLMYGNNYLLLILSKELPKIMAKRFDAFFINDETKIPVSLRSISCDYDILANFTHLLLQLFNLPEHIEETLTTDSYPPFPVKIDINSTEVLKEKRKVIAVFDNDTFKAPNHISIRIVVDESIGEGTSKIIDILTAKLITGFYLIVPTLNLIPSFRLIETLLKRLNRPDINNSIDYLMETKAIFIPFVDNTYEIHDHQYAEYEHAFIPNDTYQEFINNIESIHQESLTKDKLDNLPEWQINRIIKDFLEFITKDDKDKSPSGIDQQTISYILRKLSKDEIMFYNCRRKLIKESTLWDTTL